MAVYSFKSAPVTYGAGTPAIISQADGAVVAEILPRTSGTPLPAESQLQNERGSLIVESVNACDGATVVVTQGLLQRQVVAITAYLGAISAVNGLVKSSSGDLREVQTLKAAIQNALANLPQPPQ